MLFVCVDHASAACVALIDVVLFELSTSLICIALRACLITRDEDRHSRLYPLRRCI